MKISQKRKNTRSNWFDAKARVSEKRKNYVKTDFQFNSDVEFYASHLMRRNEKVAHKNPTQWNRRVVEIVLICVSIVNVSKQPVVVVKRLPLLTPSLGRYRVPFYCVRSIYRAAWPFFCVQLIRERTEWCLFVSSYSFSCEFRRQRVNGAAETNFFFYYLLCIVRFLTFNSLFRLSNSVFFLSLRVDFNAYTFAKLISHKRWIGDRFQLIE